MLEIDAYVEEAYSTLHHDESVLLALPDTTSRWTPKRASSPPNLLVEEHLLAQHAHRVEQLARTALQA